MVPKVNVLIADDHYLVAKLLMNNLAQETNMKVVGLARDGQETVDMLKEFDVDVLLLDIDMPIIDGMQILRDIRANNDVMKVIMLTNHSEGWIVKKAMQIGANGYLTKFAEADEVRDAINTVLTGETYFCKLSFQNLMKKITQPSAKFDKKTSGVESDDEEFDNGIVDRSQFHSNFQHLTIREKQVLKMIIEEQTSREISEKLYISSRTVETHRKNILKKLGVKNTVSLIKVVLESDLIENLPSL
jgi:DNA-binding NarL/FixJ family response regulator